MKYPSVFLAILIVWIVVDGLALAFRHTSILYSLYLSALVFSLLLFLIGFWRNK